MHIFPSRFSILLIAGAALLAFVSRGQSTRLLYAMDDKYADVSQKEMMNWLEFKIASNDMNQAIGVQSGGGPLGSEWNPSTDLFLVVQSILEDETVQVFLNKEIIDVQVFKYPTHFAVQIPENTWIRALKPAGKDHPMAQLAEELEILVLFDNKAEIHSFYAAFGE